MRKSTVAAVLAITAAAIAAPAAHAEKATFSGTCSITGVSTFDPPLTSSHQITKYDFKSGPAAEGEEDLTTCSGTLNGRSVSQMPVKATVAGEGDLSCASGNSTTPGSGAIEFPDGSRFPFGFTFEAVLTEVDFVAEFANGAKANGHASFLHYAPPTSAMDCNGAGISALGFEATTDEADMVAEGTRPDPAGTNPGPDPGATTTPGGDEKKPSAAERRRACMRKAKKTKNKKKRKKAKKRCSRIR